MRMPARMHCLDPLTRSVLVWPAVMLQSCCHIHGLVIPTMQRYEVFIKIPPRLHYLRQSLEMRAVQIQISRNKFNAILEGQW